MHAGWGRRGLIAGALLYLALLLALPVASVVWRAFEEGAGPVWDALASQEFTHALWLTVLTTAIAVPLNTIFGVAFALMVVRRKVPGRRVLNFFVDLPVALSPVIIGLALILVWGVNGWFGGWMLDHGVRVIYAVPGMVLAVIFVSLPFVVREVIPVLRTVGTDQEEAAAVLGASSSRTFWQVTLPAIKWGVAYGVILTTARALGEFGAVQLVSGRLSGQTETLTIYVDASYTSFDGPAAFTAALVLALIAVIVVVGVNLVVRKEELDEHRG